MTLGLIGSSKLAVTLEPTRLNERLWLSLHIKFRAFCVHSSECSTNVCSEPMRPVYSHARPFDAEIILAVRSLPDCVIDSVYSFRSPSTRANAAPSHHVDPALTAGPVPPATPFSVNSPPQLPPSRGNSRSASDEGPVGAAGVLNTSSPQEVVAITAAKRPANNAAREFI